MSISYRDSYNREFRHSIENHYNLELLASNSELVAERLATIIEENDEWQQDLLESHQESLDAITKQLSDMVPLLGSIDEHARQSTKLLHEALPALVQQLQQESKTLLDIQETLSGLHDQEVRAIRQKAFMLLMRALPREPQFRDEDFKQAYEMLRKVANSPTQFDDYTVWFQIGWLEWKWKRDVSAAEQAFMTARRHIADNDTRNPYYWRSLWHAAHMQYLQGAKRFSDCYKTICTAAKHTGYGPVHFDKARYAAVTGETEHALSILKQRILRWPHTFFDCQKCRDFDGMRDQVDDLMFQQLSSIRSDLYAHLVIAQQILLKAEQALAALQLSPEPLEKSEAEYANLLSIASDSNYPNMVAALPYAMQLPTTVSQEVQKVFILHEKRLKSHLSATEASIKWIKKEKLPWKIVLPPVPFFKVLPGPVITLALLGLFYFGLLCKSESQRAGDVAYQQTFASMRFKLDARDRGPRLFGVLIHSIPAPSHEDQHIAFTQEREKKASGARRLVIAKTWGKFCLVLAGSAFLLFLFSAANHQRILRPLLQAEERKRQEADKQFQSDKMPRLSPLQDLASQLNLQIAGDKSIISACMQELDSILKSTPPLSHGWQRAAQKPCPSPSPPTKSNKSYDNMPRAQRDAVIDLSDVFKDALRATTSGNKNGGTATHFSLNLRPLREDDTED